MSDLQKVLGINLRRYRDLCGLTQAELAVQTDLSQNFIGYIERGERWPSAENREALASALGVSAALLLTEGKERELTGGLGRQEILSEVRTRVMQSLEQTFRDLEK